MHCYVMMMTSWWRNMIFSTRGSSNRISRRNSTKKNRESNSSNRLSGMSFDGEIIPEGTNSKISSIFLNLTKVYGHFKMYLKGVRKKLWDFFVESRLSFETNIGSLFRQKVSGLLVKIIRSFSWCCVWSLMTVYLYVINGQNRVSYRLEG